MAVEFLLILLAMLVLAMAVSFLGQRSSQKSSEMREREQQQERIDFEAYDREQRFAKFVRDSIEISKQLEMERKAN